MQALILVDLQNDFLPKGRLPVPGGDAVVDVANRLMPLFDLVIALQDWHPPNHGSFAANHPGHRRGETVKLAGLSQLLWPTHCVQGTTGAALCPRLDLSQIDRVIRKGTDPRLDAHSGFHEAGRRRSTGLDDYLRRHEVHELFIMGLATEHCVKHTALDARELQWDTVVLLQGCRGFDARPGDVEGALNEMRAAGVRLSESDEQVGAG